MSIFDKKPWMKKATIVGGLILSAGMVAFMFVGSNQNETTQIELPLSSPSQSRGGTAVHPYSPESRPEIWERKPTIFQPSITTSKQDTDDEETTRMEEGVGFTVCAIAMPWDRVLGNFEPATFIKAEAVIWIGVGNPPSTRDDGKPISFAFQDKNGDGLLQFNETISVGEFLGDQQEQILAYRGTGGVYTTFAQNSFSSDAMGLGAKGDMISDMIANDRDWEIDLKNLNSGC